MKRLGMPDSVGDASPICGRPDRPAGIAGDGWVNCSGLATRLAGARLGFV